MKLFNVLKPIGDIEFYDFNFESDNQIDNPENVELEILRRSYHHSSIGASVYSEKLKLIQLTNDFQNNNWLGGVTRRFSIYDNQPFPSHDVLWVSQLNKFGLVKIKDNSLVKYNDQLLFFGKSNVMFLSKINELSDSSIDFLSRKGFEIESVNEIYNYEEMI